MALIVKYGADIETAIRFNFNRGEFVSKQILFSSDEKNGRIEERIVNGRYLLTDNRTMDSNAPKDELTFDLLANKTVKNSIRSTLFPKFDKDEQYKLRSPDNSSWITIKPITEMLDELVIHRNGGKVLKVSGPFRVSVAQISSILPNLPVMWIDNDRLLTQRENGSLVLISMDGTTTDFPKVPCTSDDFPGFIQTRTKRLIYRCGNDFLLNIDDLSFKQIRHDLDFGFSWDNSAGGTLYYDDAPIGSDGFDDLTARNYIAYTEGKSRGGMTASSTINTVKVWNTFTKKWQTFQVDDGWLELIGWYEY